MKFERTVSLEDADTLFFSFSFFGFPGPFNMFFPTYVFLYNLPLILMSLELFSC